MLDLRRVPRKRALAVLSEARRSGDGRVCAWVRATEDGTPVFAPDASMLSRFAAPAIVSAALVACSPSAMHPASTTTLAHEAPPVTVGGNQNAPRPPAPIVVAAPTPSVTPATNVHPVIVETAGDIAF